MSRTRRGVRPAWQREGREEKRSARALRRRPEEYMEEEYPKAGATADSSRYARAPPERPCSQKIRSFSGAPDPVLPGCQVTLALPGTTEL